MLRVHIVQNDKAEFEIKNIFSAVYNSETGVPADDFTISFGYDQKVGENADYLKIFSDDKLIFYGQIDEIINAENSSGVITQITARSLAGQLVDNEAEPITYYNPCARLIYEKYLEPYGIKWYECDNIPAYGFFKIDKGMTQWQVFENFCKNKFGVQAVISGDGTAYFEGLKNNKKLLFAKGGDIEYNSIKEKIQRYKLISDVYLKLKSFSNYDGVIQNKSDACKNIKRVRYVNALSEKSTIETADKIIEQSNIDSYGITLECCGCYLDILGADAKIEDEILGIKDNLKIKKIRYSLSNDGEYTVVGLGKESV